MTKHADPRPTAELISVIANDDPSLSEFSDEAHKAKLALLFRGTREVWEAARELCLSEDRNNRAAGLGILGELGQPDRVFSDESVDVFVQVLQSETELNVIRTAMFALGHLQNHRSDAIVIPYAGDPDDEVRYGVAFALCGSTSVEIIPTLLTLMDDPYEMARDWATTAIGQTLEWDGPDIREALLNRTDDPDEITCAEALHGLARRRDSSAIPFLIKRIEEPGKHLDLFLDAAKSFLGIAEEAKIEAADLLLSLRRLNT